MICGGQCDEGGGGGNVAFCNPGTTTKITQRLEEYLIICIQQRGNIYQNNIVIDEESALFT